jgi:dTDP-4-amino-4,6-dideoxyglucose formyltransferase
MGMRYAFAGNQQIGLQVLTWLREQGCDPAAILVPSPDHNHWSQLILDECSFLPDEAKLVGVLPSDDLQDRIQSILTRLDVDYLISIHYPYMLPSRMLGIPKVGCVNLHPAYLPFNRGWHTPTWAIWDDTPFGATLHFMNDGIDTGDIICRRQLEIDLTDTAHTLYQKALALEFEVFKDSFAALLSLNPPRIRQEETEGSTHGKKDLAESGLLRIDADELVRAGDLIRRLRALTTNQISEAVTIEIDGVRCQVQVNLENSLSDL